jgi:phosphatidylethanolamine-binding protein (PEBP) family uncharacterized protein
MHFSRPASVVSFFCSAIFKKLSFLMVVLVACALLPAAARAQCTLNTTDPSVTICTPANNATVSSPVHIVAGTTDSHTVIAMKIYVDGVSQFSGTSNSIDTSLAMAAGTHRITVKAWDNASPQQVFSQTINITVGTGGGGSFTVSPSSLTFASQNVGTTSAAQAVTVSNGTSGAVSISSIQATGDFAQTNNCGTSLAAGGSCTVNVTFTPTAAGPRSGTLTITDSAAGSPHSVGLSGTGATSGTCSLSSTDPSVTICAPANNATVSSPVHIVAGTTDSHTVVTMKIYVDGVSQFSTTSNAIDTSLPMATGAHRITVKAWDNASPQQVFSQTINITVGPGGGGGSFTVSPTSLTFANQTVGTTSAPQTVTLNNTTANAISITSIATSGDFAQTNNCGTSLAANASCTVNVTFTPSTTGTRSGTLTMTDSDASSPQTVSLTGTGGTSSNCSLSSTNPSVTICQPANNATVSSPVHIVAGTTDSHTVIAMKIYVDGVVQFSGTSNSIDTSLAMATGAHRITVKAWDNAVPQQVFSQTINITVGTGGGGGSVTVSPSSLTFGAQAVNTTSPAQSVTLSNGTSSALAISSISASGDFAETNTCGTSLAAGANCTISVTFTPTATGTRSGTLTITDSDASSPQTVGLTGTGGTGGGGSGLNVLTYHYNNARTGLNPNETILTPQNVNSTTFGKLFTYSVDGFVFAQPLYVSGLTIGGKTRNVVFIATENDSVYAFDADSNTQLWHTGFTNGSTIVPVPSTDVNDSNTGTTSGITGTPVIDLGTNTIYVVAATKENTSYFQRLHALDLITGAEKFNGPHNITASVPGTGSPNDGNGNVMFDPKLELQRPGLMLSGGVVYVAWGSHNDTSPWHGWVMAFDSGTLGLISAWNVTPSGNAGGIWASGGAITTDGNGNIYVMTGNGTNNTGSGGNEFGQSFVNLRLTNGKLAPVDFFTPFNYSTLNASDVDVGSGSVLLIPGNAHAHLAIGGGKQGRLYVLDAGNLGGFNASADGVIQERDDFPSNKIYGPPAFWNGNVYLGAGNNPINQYTLSSTDQLSLATHTPTVYGTRGAIPTISSNGNTAGIVWAAENTSAMHAYDAANISNELYNTTQNSARDAAAGNKFPSITVINGKVYVPQRNAVTVYGLL